MGQPTCSYLKWECIQIGFLEAMLLSETLQILPASLSARFWEKHTQAVWHSLDTFVCIITFSFYPASLLRFPDKALALSHLPLYVIKAWHLWYLRRTRSSGYSFRTRNTVIISERIARMVASYVMSRIFEEGKLGKLFLLASLSSQESSFRVTAEAAKQLLLGAGSTVMLWHSFFLPTVWALEGLLLIPLLLMSLYLRAPLTAQYLASFPAGSAVHAMKVAAAAVCVGACRSALPVAGLAGAVCSLRAPHGSEMHTERHLVGTFIIFVQYLVPLYIRYVMEHEAKRRFLWPHLSDEQKASFVLHQMGTGSSSTSASGRDGSTGGSGDSGMPATAASSSSSRRAVRLLLAGAMHLLAVTYLLAFSVVCARLAEQHLMPPRAQQRLEAT